MIAGQVKNVYYAVETKCLPHPVVLVIILIPRLASTWTGSEGTHVCTRSTLLSNKHVLSGSEK